jgi:hypothetical protein
VSIEHQVRPAYVSIEVSKLHLHACPLARYVRFVVPRVALLLTIGIPRAA